MMEDGDNTVLGLVRSTLALSQNNTLYPLLPGILWLNGNRIVVTLTKTFTLHISVLL